MTSDTVNALRAVVAASPYVPQHALAIVRLVDHMRHLIKVRLSEHAVGWVPTRMTLTRYCR